MLSMLQDNTFEKVLDFAETRHRVSHICRDLHRAGISPDQLSAAPEYAQLYPKDRPYRHFSATEPRK